MLPDEAGESKGKSLTAKHHELPRALAFRMSVK
jgi:hypothetical protein